MKLFLKILFTGLISMSFASCTNNKPKKSLDNGAVVKIVKTSAFYAKNEFEKYIPGEPAYNIGYDRTMGMDFSWRIEYFDEYGNILTKKDYHLNDKGEDETLVTTYNVYYSSEDGKLSHIKIDYPHVTKENKYIRNDQGILMEIHSLKDGKMFEKEICTYNESGQRIKEEIFFKENGLVKVNQYTYDLPSLSDGKIIINHFLNLKRNTKHEYYFTWSDSDHLIKSRDRCYVTDNLFYDETTYYESYVGNIASKEITENYSTLSKSYNIPYLDRTTIERSFDSYRNITRYIRTSKEIDQDGHEFESSLIRDNAVNCECEYTYNERNDWVKLLLTVSPPNKYIIIREITYID